MFFIGVAHGRGVVGVAGAAGDEKGVICIKHLFRQHLEPLSGQPSRIFALLPPDIYFYPSLQGLRSCLHNLREAVFKNLLPSNMQVHHVVFGFLSQPLELCLEDHVFVVEGEHVGGGDGNFENGYL